MMKAAILVSALLALQATAAGATDVDAPPSERVSFADLNLGSLEGRATLERRIAAAVERVCSDGSLDLPWGQFEKQSCIHAALSKAHFQRDRLVLVRDGPTNEVEVADIQK